MKNAVVFFIEKAKTVVKEMNAHREAPVEKIKGWNQDFTPQAAAHPRKPEAIMELKGDITERALREQYAASRLALLGITFADAIQRESILITLQCGAKAAAKASRYHQSRPHWAATEH